MALPYPAAPLRSLFDKFMLRRIARVDSPSRQIAEQCSTHTA